MSAKIVKLMVSLGMISLTGCRLTASATAQDSGLEGPRLGTPEHSVTVLPIRVLGEPSQDVADALALLLEQEGMNRMGTTPVSFAPDKEAAWDSIPDSLSDFVRDHSLPGDFVIYAEFLGTPHTGATEVRAVLVNTAGDVVWIDRQTGKDADFARAQPKAPMECCKLLVERMRPLFSLTKETRKHARPGAMAQRWRMKSGTPDASELEAMKGRQATFAKSLSAGTIAVYPQRIGAQARRDQDGKLADLWSKVFGSRMRPAGQHWHAEVAPNTNEQKRLWQFAVTFRDEVRRQPPDADYSVATDYLLDPKGGPAPGVHFVVVDRQGEWVIVDFQNSYHRDYHAIEPKTADDADQLVIRRLKVLLGM